MRISSRSDSGWSQTTGTGVFGDGKRGFTWKGSPRPDTHAYGRQHTLRPAVLLAKTAHLRSYNILELERASHV